MPESETPLALHPDRFLPTDPSGRAVARRLFEAVCDLPVVSPHGHVDARLLLDDEPFTDPAALFVTPDHYVTRLLHADGVDLADLGVGQGTLDEAHARQVWRRLCDRWHLFRGTPVRMWLESELADIFGVTVRPSAATAEAIYDHLAERLSQDAYRPRALFHRFRIAVLATTDDPCDDLSAHRALAADPAWSGRVVPTFRPDRYLEPDRPGWCEDVTRLGQAAEVDVGDYRGYVAALEGRRRHFIDHGARASDHGHVDARTDPLGESEAAGIYRRALAGTVGAEAAAAFRRHMVAEMARMSCDDGLVMMLHTGVRRDHHAPSARAYGRDIGADIPVRAEFTDALRPLLERFGTYPGFHLVVFTADESAWSRELAPLAGFYPSVFVGVPWWFLDAPDAIRRFRAAVTETAGFARTSGFVDDTRAFCSIPARHDMARRIDAGVLAAMVCDHRLDEGEALDVAVDLVTTRPTAVFKL